MGSNGHWTVAGNHSSVDMVTTVSVDMVTTASVDMVTTASADMETFLLHEPLSQFL